MKSSLFVIVQFLLILAIALYAGVWGSATQNVVMFAGVALGIWAVTTMRLKVNVLPNVRDDQKLFTSGPYRYVRHPMYTAIILVTFAWVLHRFDAISVGFWLLLVVNLVLKLRYEEELLSKKFSNYKTYKKRTKRLIPYII